MIEQPGVWRATGLYWHSRTPGLGLANHLGTEHTWPVPPRTRIGYQLGGTRCCIGIWLADQHRRQPCPFATPIPPSSTSTECDACTTADSGKQLARDTRADDGRFYALYLAWFGPRVFKVGLTAVDRSTDRPAEQGALAFTWLARGPFPAVRAAEQAVAATGLAPERRRRATKLAAWRQIPEPTQRDREIHATYRQIIDRVAWPAGLQCQDCTVVDHTGLFGLDRLPEHCEDITELAAGSVLAGSVRCVLGRELLLDTEHGPLLLDTRLLAGWPVHPSSSGCTDLPRRPIDTGNANDSQQSLF